MQGEGQAAGRTREPEVTLRAHHHLQGWRGAGRRRRQAGCQALVCAWHSPRAVGSAAWKRWSERATSKGDGRELQGPPPERREGGARRHSPRGGRCCCGSAPCWPPAGWAEWGWDVGSGPLQRPCSRGVEQPPTGWLGCRGLGAKIWATPRPLAAPGPSPGPTASIGGPPGPRAARWVAHHRAEGGGCEGLAEHDWLCL